MYRVLNWDRHFEGAKSKTYDNKTSCMLPTKHGLGYKKLIKSKDGPALFAAWVALIQVLSRHGKPRQGYCTDTGRSDGIPYTCDDLELLTDIPAKYFAKMLEICKSHHVGWVALTKLKDTADDCEDTMVPSNLDSNSNLNSNLDSISSEPETDSEQVVLSFECTGQVKQWNLTKPKLDEWKEAYDTIDVFQCCKQARQWLNDNPSRKKTAKGMTKFLGSWMSRQINSGRTGTATASDNKMTLKELFSEK